MRHIQQKQTKQQNNNHRIGRLLLKLLTLYKLMTIIHLRTW